MTKTDHNMVFIPDTYMYSVFHPYRVCLIPVLFFLVQIWILPHRRFASFLGFNFHALVSDFFTFEFSAIVYRIKCVRS